MLVSFSALGLTSRVLFFYPKTKTMPVVGADGSFQRFFGCFVFVFVKVFSAIRAIIMCFHTACDTSCRDFLYPSTIGMLSKINIYFLFLHRKSSIYKRSGIFHFAFFFAGCRFNYRSGCSYRFAFDMRVVVLTNSFRFASVVARPSVFCFAPVVDMNIGLLGIIIRHGLTAPIHYLVVSFCPNERMSKHCRWSCPIKLATYRKRYYGFICIRHWSSVLELVLNIYVCISLS